MKQLLACFAPHGEAPRPIRSRLEASLNVFTDSEIFLLNTIANSEALCIVFAASFAHIGEVEVENYAAVIHIDRNHEIRVHVTFIAINHEVRILPEVPGTIAFAGCTRGGIFFRRDHRTRLQTVAILILDGVLLVVENAVQSLVQMGHVIAAVQVVVDEYFPVAGDFVRSAIEVAQLGEIKWFAPLYKTAQKVPQRLRLRVQTYEDEGFPSVDLDGNQSVVLALEILYAI